MLSQFGKPGASKVLKNLRCLAICERFDKGGRPKVLKNNRFSSVWAGHARLVEAGPENQKIQVS